MSLSLTDIIGYGAASATTLSFLPQVLRVWRSRSARDISAFMYALFIFGLALWTLYGSLRGDWPIVGANVVTMLLASTVLWMKWRFGRQPV